jgi:NAD+ kinase
MKPGAIGVVVHPRRDSTDMIECVVRWAEGHGKEVRGLEEAVDLLPSSVRTVPEEELAVGAGLLMGLGGDGTILRALQLAMGHHSAVLGVNFGTVGFLADIDGADLTAALDKIARGEAEIDARTALVATLEARGAPPDRHVIAFNDVVIGRIPGHGTARLRVTVGGQPMLRLTGDGVVVASPTGSTAYTVGAGGPAVAPSLDAIVITPLATQGSPLRSLVADGSDMVRIELEPLSAPVNVEIDGRTSHEMPAAAAVEIHAAPRKARLVRTRPRTFYEDLAGRI